MNVHDRNPPSVTHPSIYNDTPKPPVFATVAEERLHRKQRLAASFRLFSKFGFDEGVVGHITARDPEFTDSFWVNPFGMHFSLIKASDLIRVGHDGKVIEGNRPVNAAAFAIHSRIHTARPDSVGAAHAHSTYGRAFAALGRKLDPISQDVCAFYNDHALYEDYGGVAVDLDEGQQIATALGQNKYFRIMGCSPLGRPLTRRRGGSSRWNARARSNCSPRRPQHTPSGLSSSSVKKRLIKPIRSSVLRSRDGFNFSRFIPASSRSSQTSLTRLSNQA
jgi:ribulose-5-phosphate 4-epimerase/fuculose-1-phosphate aldolase